MLYSAFVEILNSQLADEMTLESDCRADFWEFPPNIKALDATQRASLFMRHCAFGEILRNQLADEMTIENECRADSFENSFENLQ